MIGEFADEHEATILIGTPTFYQAYIRKCEPHQFRALRYGVVGAEKLREPIARGFKEKFGLDVTRGQFSTYKSLAKKKSGSSSVGRKVRKGGKRKVAVAADIARNGLVALDHLEAVRSLVQKVGAEQVKRLVGLFE